MRHTHEVVGHRTVRDQHGNKTGERPVMRWFTTVSVTHPGQLAHGLYIERVGTLARIASKTLGEDDWDIGDDELRAAFDFARLGELHEDARDVLRDPEVHRALRPMTELDMPLHVRHDVATLRTKGRVTSKETLVETVERTEALFDALAAATERVRASRGEALAEWLELAREGWAGSATATASRARRTASR